MSQAEKNVDVTKKLAESVNAGALRIQASNNLGGDPLFGMFKQLKVEYTIDGESKTIVVNENEYLELPEGNPGVEPPATVTPTADGWTVTAREGGEYELVTATGGRVKATIPAPPAPMTVEGSWEVRFAKGWGAPESIQMPKLVSWSKFEDSGVQHFSGTATYVKTLDISEATVSSGRPLSLDLGDIRNIAEVRVNGKSLGVLWKPPYRVALDGVVHAGANQLEIDITNLWPNRLIGDAALPEDQRFTWTTFSPYKKDTPLFDAGILGPVTLQTAEVAQVKTP